MTDNKPRRSIFKFIQIVKTDVTRNSHISLAVSNEDTSLLVVGLERGMNGITVAFSREEAIQMRERLIEAINNMTE